MRRAVVLSGGGSLGAMQVGALRAMIERAIVPHIVVGCSVGALNASFLAT
ncbi:MAG: patatin-like phospholipase family protein, partial [Caldilinea sp.]|nr:patatin-like phospholipase family protein [Caldilinea sp.]